MIYILTALKPEAQAIVDKYRLKKSKLNNFTVFFNEEITIIISGIGVVNANTATLQLLNNYIANKNDTFLNIGICGANSKYTIGELIEIDSIEYANETYLLNKDIKNTITCLDKEATDDSFNIVDMESFGFYEATKELGNVRIFKVVSDHFEPLMVTKEITKSLIFNVIEEIINKVKRCV